ncbi:hypothetical protein S40288_09481 [Stachybotrys chartarum IBT 40288]|nr:hypothetical protein S40288_09481 [Stachybotrys chartarum IBT 40288]
MRKHGGCGTPLLRAFNCAGRDPSAPDTDQPRANRTPLRVVQMSLRWKQILDWGRGRPVSTSLVLSAWASELPPAPPPSASALATQVALAIIVIGFGIGDFKPKVNILITEQLGDPRMCIKPLKSRERVIVDPRVMVSAHSAVLLLHHRRCARQPSHHGVRRAMQRLLPVLHSADRPPGLLPPIAIWGHKRCLRRPPSGSVLEPAMMTFALAQKSRSSINPFQPHKEAVNNNLISKEATTERHGVPNDILSKSEPLLSPRLRPAYDLLIYPTLRRADISFTPIKKIVAGFLMGCAAMIGLPSCGRGAAVVQYYIYEQSKRDWYASGEIFYEAVGDMRGYKPAPI